MPTALTVIIGAVIAFTIVKVLLCVIIVVVVVVLGIDNAVVLDVISLLLTALFAALIDFVFLLFDTFSV